MLGIAEDGPDVYEGSSWLHALYPPPFLIPIALVSVGNVPNPPDTGRVAHMPFLFREDSFDPTSRIKRGRVYRRDNTIPRDCIVFPHPARITEASAVGLSSRGVLLKPLAQFHPYVISSNLDRRLSDQLLVTLGTKDAYSLWIIVDRERVHTNEELVTLRAVRSFGSFPLIRDHTVPEHGKAKVLQTSEKLLSEMNKATPESIIDRSREVMVAAIKCYLREISEERLADDLGQLANTLEDIPDQDRKLIAANAAKIVGRLHARGKISEQEKRKVRPIMEQDAELAVSCVGVTLCDFGWAEWV